MRDGFSSGRASRVSWANRPCIRVLIGAAVAAIIAGTLGATCGENGFAPGGQGDEHYYHNFQSAVAGQPTRGFTTYWLGREFESGGVVFAGPQFADFGETNSGDHFEFDYEARIQDGSRERIVTLELNTYSSQKWQQSSARILNPPGSLELLPDSPDGVGARTYRRTNERGEFDAVLAIVTFSDGVVVAAAGTDGPFAGRAYANPLVETGALSSVLQELRPYPQ